MRGACAGIGWYIALGQLRASSCLLLSTTAVGRIVLQHLRIQMVSCPAVKHSE